MEDRRPAVVAVYGAIDLIMLVDKHNKQPPLGITGVLCVNRTIEIAGRGTLHYTIYRPRMLQQQQQQQTAVPPPPAVRNKCNISPQQHNTNPQLSLLVGRLPTPNPPLICVAGGPGMPCQYLTSLVHTVPDRAVIVYDHMGCGHSLLLNPNLNPTNANVANASTLERTKSFLESTVDDLTVLIAHALPGSESVFHLFGHSFGGVVAFEYLKAQVKQQKNTRMDHHHRCCLSVIMASAPASIAASHASSAALLAGICREMQSEGFGSSATTTTTTGRRQQDYDDDSDDDDDDIEDMDDDTALLRAAHREFQLRHECRVEPMPLTLQQSLTGLKNNLSVNEQQAELQQYVATVADLDDCSCLPPALILRGQYDFVADDNTLAWTDLFVESQYVTVSNCSHYGLVEQEEL